MSAKARPLKIALVGASGRMGHEVEAVAKDLNVNVIARVETEKDWEAVDQSIDLVVDFSTPEGLAGALKWCTANKKAIVSGSTGLSEQDRTALKTAAKKIPVFYSGNMSLGIAVMSAMLETFAAVTDWDFQVDEIHHIHKKDKPSGTALLLQNKLTEVLKRDVPPPIAARGGGVPGVHTVIAMGADELLTVQHTAFNRRIFARGALKAGRWLFDKNEPGLYNLTDLYQTSTRP